VGNKDNSFQNPIQYTARQPSKPTRKMLATRPGRRNELFYETHIGRDETRDPKKVHWNKPRMTIETLIDVLDEMNTHFAFHSFILPPLD